MKKYSWIIILLNLFLFLGFFNYSIFKKEKLLDNGTLVLMELAPVDPRSLIQGDYMRLQYKLASEMVHDSIPPRGLCAIEPNADGVAQKIRVLHNNDSIGTNEHIVKYSAKKWWGIRIGAESYFFQEGEAEKYENAKYGCLKIDAEGNSILIGLYDDTLKKIE
ncbi:hypothetical protein GO009_01310 [Muricauda sp. TY007]|uniref:GDYXXLXY domain-containing protein n=1 Tax=Allomuricauda sp. TY007 TaxID=2683200 RepID=UPI0013BF17C2|nr:GDYXXLXY domain-containing protein [Muricauda sp. TY007]NDV14649.1 hypothetical protein [Muricauda sp. TY007]